MILGCRPVPLCLQRRHCVSLAACILVRTWLRHQLVTHQRNHRSYSDWRCSASASGCGTDFGTAATAPSKPPSSQRVKGRQVAAPKWPPPNASKISDAPQFRRLRQQQPHPPHRVWIIGLCRPPTTVSDPGRDPFRHILRSEHL